ncbi:hypothetical protein GCM10022200_01490 [Microbacterium awajiense]|uniref:Uncharacterized protein n=1 Tax=Microbacterium awajiense TaxID=415214 RepID=A0ABP7A0A1_9MICO
MRTRAVVGVVAAVLAAGMLAGSPAAAEDEPLVWSAMDGYPKNVDGVVISWETAMSSTSPFDGQALLDALPVMRLDVENRSGETVHVGLGMDLVAHGEVGHLWERESWGPFIDVLSGVEETFVFALEDGEAFSDVVESVWTQPLPMWSGHTGAVFELSEMPAEGVSPSVTLLDAMVIPGRFVGANFAPTDLSTPSAIMGIEATVDGGGGSPDLFPGLSATVTASDLTPGELLEVWVAPQLDFFAFQLYGGALPADARQVGTGTVAADGTLTSTVTLPSDLPFGRYQLAAGVRAERYWPAGTFRDFTVTTPPAERTVSVASGGGTTIADLGTTGVTVTYPASTTEGATTATVSSTGPTPSGFVLTSYPPLYYHLSTTSTFTGQAEVCIDYDPVNLPGAPPYLYHFSPVLGAWENITTSRNQGRVCGLTESFSPVVLGYPDEPDGFDFTGFFDPVSNDEMNLAKAGQAIPVTFSLGGDQGLEVVASTRFSIDRTVTNPSGELLDAVTAGKSSLSYDAASDQYTFVWKTNKAWANKQGHFVLTLSDGSAHEFAVTFRK